MKHIALALHLVLLPFIGLAAHVDPATAHGIAQHFLQGTSVRGVNGQPVSLALAYRIGSEGINGSVAATDHYYVFNVQNGDGFVIIAADDAVTPVLGYSDQNDYDPDRLPTNLAKWMGRYQQAIAAAISSQASADNGLQQRWAALNEGPLEATADDRSVNPLLQTNWNQAPYYNALCPGNSVTGCVATAMAQIMKFWNHPANGTGFHSYAHQNYGTLSFNYASTEFQWGNMPNSINGPNNAIATLMYAAGISVDMDYSPEVSGAWVISSHTGTPPNCAEYALKTYFGYDANAQGLARDAYSDVAWVNLLKNELDNGRPVLYDGFGTGGGHCWDLDGYDNNNLFHANWGWGGSYNGYFAISDMSPGGVGIGGGNGGFNAGQEAVIGIHPPGGGAQTSDLQLYANVVPSANPIYYGQGFSVTTNIYNAATSTFNGDYCAALFDAQGTFVDYVEVLTGNSLPAGYVYNPPGLTFTSAGSFTYLPGDYRIGIFSKPSGGNWQMVAEAGAYTNLVPFTIVNPNDVEMYAAMNVTTGTPMTSGANVNVTLDVANYGFSDINAVFDLSLYNMDGSFATTIATTNSLALCSNCHFIGGLYFNNPALNASAGSYLMALLYSTDNGSSWQLVGSTDHSNPVIVTVQAPGIGPDIYENNDTYAASYLFTPSFTNNVASVNTTGSNCHVGTDDDFYGVNLPAGYEYTISARLHDAYNSGNGNTYSLDALFSTTTDGTNWSGPFDDIMPNSFSASGGDPLRFHVAPYFEGQTGTYLLDIDISRAPVGIGTSAMRTGLRLMPNPAMDRLVIEREEASPLLSVEAIDAAGRRIPLRPEPTSALRSVVNVEQLAAGAYRLQVRTDNGVQMQGFIKCDR